MNRYLTTLMFMLCLTMAHLSAQNERFLYGKDLSSYQVKHVRINHSNGLCLIHPSRSPLSARAELSSYVADEETLERLDEWIDIVETVIGDTLVLTTKFDERFGQPASSQLVEDYNNSLMKLLIRVPIEMSVEVHTKNGMVEMGGGISPVKIHAERSSVKLNQMDSVLVSGDHIFLYLNRINHSVLDLTDSEVETVVMKQGELNLVRSSLSAKGFERLVASLEDVTASLGASDTCDLTLLRGSLTCSHITSHAAVTATDAIFNISRPPIMMSAKMTRGMLNMASDDQRTSEFILDGQDMNLTIDAKFTALNLSELGTKYTAWFKDGQPMDDTALKNVQQTTAAMFTGRGRLSGGQVKLRRIRG